MAWGFVSSPIVDLERFRDSSRASDMLMMDQVSTTTTGSTETFLYHSSLSQLWWNSFSNLLDYLKQSLRHAARSGCKCVCSFIFGVHSPIPLSSSGMYLCKKLATKHAHFQTKTSKLEKKVQLFGVLVIFWQSFWSPTVPFSQLGVKTIQRKNIPTVFSLVLITAL